MKVALVLHPGFTALDVVGPFQVLAAAPGVETMLVAHELGSVADDTARCPLVATATFSDVPAPEVVVVPGSELSLDLDPVVVDWLRKAHATTSWTTSVGTGSSYLAAAGVLAGKEATTHWASPARIGGAGAHWSSRRVVHDGRVITAAGSTAGIDMALTLLGLSHGPAVAQAVQLAIEYDPEPPYDAGSPAKAPHQISDLVRSYYLQRVYDPGDQTP
jgi:transcriptional regulator GlxA family with amidase domain